MPVLPTHSNVQYLISLYLSIQQNFTHRRLQLFSSSSSSFETPDMLTVYFDYPGLQL